MHSAKLGSENSIESHSTAVNDFTEMLVHDDDSSEDSSSSKAKDIQYPAVHNSHGSHSSLGTAKSCKKKHRSDPLQSTKSKPSTKYAGRYRKSTSGNLFWLPLLLCAGFFILFDLLVYIFVRQWVSWREHFLNIKGRKQILRKRLNSATNYQEWSDAAKELDEYLGMHIWKLNNDETDVIDIRLLKKVVSKLRRYRLAAIQESTQSSPISPQSSRSSDPLASKTVHSTTVDDPFTGSTSEYLYTYNDALPPAFHPSAQNLPDHPSIQISNLAKLCDILKTSCCKINVAGIDKEDPYRFTYFGTISIVDQYVSEVIHSLEYVAASPHISNLSKYALFRDLSRTFGRSALCLSGGASFGFNHLGVIKALLEQGLLPKMITGTSAGSFIGAMVAVRTDDELKKEILVPEVANRIRFSQESLYTCWKRLWKTGAWLDPKMVQEQIKYFTKGDMTFLEAYQRTGRIFNVAVVSHESPLESKLLNYLTSPDVVIYSAIIASSAIPAILPPALLISKNPRTGELKPFRSAGCFWRDGSLRSDIPQHEFRQLFNISYTIVSQVNPHVALFYFNPRGGTGSPIMHRGGHGWRGGFFASLIVQYFLLDLQKWLSFIRDMDLLPRILGADLSNLWLQSFGGDVTILPPRPHLMDYARIMCDPSSERIQRHFHDGQLASYSKVQMIGHRLRVEQCLERILSDCFGRRQMDTD
ncbi:hypothetical protein MT418_008039 [Batrachochytrium dendrobatidis]